MDRCRFAYWTVIDSVCAMAIFLILCSMLGCEAIPGTALGKDVMGVGLTGVNHMSSSYNIMEFYVDSYSGGNVGRHGGGGGLVCCVMIPKKWRPGLMVEVRWMVGDWSKEVRSEIEAGIYRSIGTEGIYIARVPLEHYSSPGRVYVHFFSGGRVRVVSSDPGSRSPFHPVIRNDPNAATLAVTGTRVDKIFTENEQEEFRRKYGRGYSWK